MSSTARRAAGAPASRQVLPDEILADIFLRLDAAADLARASAVCTAFLRAVRFLRRNRSLYRAPVVGFLEPRCSLLHHAEPPHGSASDARALAGAADFACSFLPDPGSWRLLDATGGRLLLASRRPVGDDNTTGFDDLAVCDPFHRRHVRVPRVPVDLIAGLSRAHRIPFLVPTGEEEDGSPLVVVWRVVIWESDAIICLVFSSAIGEWRGVTLHGWRGVGGCMLISSCRYHPHRCLYRPSGKFAAEVLMLDTHKMEFSVARIPLVHNRREQAIVEAGEGRLGLLALGDGVLDLYCKTWPDNGVGGEDWQHEKTIPLPDGFRYKYLFIGAGGGYLLLQASPRDSAEPASDSQPMLEQYFTLQLKTLLVERLCALDKCINFAFLYTNFLPPMSLPSV